MAKVHRQFNFQGRRTMGRFALILIPAGLLALSVFGGETLSPYAGQETRTIKALSDADIEGYLSGSGMGFAKVAELNRYPGPRHVLDMAKPLEISETQLARTRKIFQGMKAKAVELGKQIITKERQLDSLFSNRAITPARLEGLTVEIGRLNGELRHAHLAAHLEMTRVLSPEQIEHYDVLRGYTSQPGHKHEQGEHRM